MVSNGICIPCGNSVWIRSMGAQVRPEQRQAIVATVVSLIACFVITSPELIWGVSSVAGVLTSGLSCYALLIFGFHLLNGMELVRPATVRRWQALVLLLVAALSAWILAFLHVPSLSRLLRRLLLPVYWPD